MKPISSISKASVISSVTSVPYIDFVWRIMFSQDIAFIFFMDIWIHPKNIRNEY